MVIWRPVLAQVVTMEEVKKGIVTLTDLAKINALLDMKADLEYYYCNKKGGI